MGLSPHWAKTNHYRRQVAQERYFLPRSMPPTLTNLDSRAKKTRPENCCGYPIEIPIELKVSPNEPIPLKMTEKNINPHWDEATNKAIFGKCNNPHYHGHNYELIVKVIGEINPETGYVMDMKVLSDIIQQHIIERFDHRNLNEDCAAFKNLNPTAENIAVVIYDILRKEINQNLLPWASKCETKKLDF